MNTPIASDKLAAKVADKVAVRFAVSYYEYEERFGQGYRN